MGLDPADLRGPVIAAGQGHPGLGWPYEGPSYIKGEDWLPYRPATDPAPPFAEYASGHSTFSKAAAEVLTGFTGRGNFELQVTIAAGSSRVEPKTATQPGVPAKPITLSWTNFRHAAEQAGLSRQYGGVHFEHGDKDARAARHPLPGTCGGRRRSASLRSPGDEWPRCMGRRSALHAAAPAGRGRCRTADQRRDGLSAWRRGPLLLGARLSLFGLSGPCLGQLAPVGGQGLTRRHVLGHIGQPPGRGPGRPS